MKRALLVLATLVFAGGAQAFECPLGKEGPLAPIKWSAEAGQRRVEVRIGVKSTFPKEIRMVDAGLWLEDGLGRLVPDQGLEIDPDLRIAPNGANIASMSYFAGLDRLIAAAPGDFTPHICTRAVLFTDGTKAEF